MSQGASEDESWKSCSQLVLQTFSASFLRGRSGWGLSMILPKICWILSSWNVTIGCLPLENNLFIKSHLKGDEECDCGDPLMCSASRWNWVFCSPVKKYIGWIYFCCRCCCCPYHYMLDKHLIQVMLRSPWGRRTLATLYLEVFFLVLFCFY